jgi:cold shock CspA family protein
MRKLLTALSGLALLLAVGIANAEDAKGIVKEINTTEAWVMLEDGTQFVLAEGITMEELKAGDEVTVSYEMKEGKKVATAVSKSQ